MNIPKTVNLAENSQRITEAKALARKEMIAMMQHYFPIVMTPALGSNIQYNFKHSTDPSTLPLRCFP
uniref:Uncharacterized protein n=1 Tax=Phlebotomus papatasi TaxID=29031 RepID=A0A1B0DLF2_PHLPP